jgi:ABC-type sugar transport system ATPase subunit
MASVRFTNVTKRYDAGSEPAIRNLSLDVEEHEFFVLLGPSGCGKSTLLKLLAGLEEPDDGLVLLDGEVVNYRPPADRDVAMVFQSYALYPQMSVAQNVEFPLRMRRVKKPVRREKARAAARSLGLEPFLERNVGDLSGGQRQRVAVARALVREPRVLLMDEPLSNLDAQLRVETREELMRVHRDSPRTVIYVTHDQVEATTMADRVAVMRTGAIEQVGTPDDIYGFPRNTFVAGFVGSPRMNLIPGAGGPLPLDGLADRQGITLGLRPEMISVVPPEEGIVQGRVRLRETIGYDRVLLVDVGGHELRVRTSRSDAGAEGELLGLAWRPNDLHVFDADGERMER